MDKLELAGLKRILLVPDFIYKDKDLFNEYIKVYDISSIDTKIVDISNVIGLLDLLNKDELAMLEVWNDTLVDFIKPIRLANSPLFHKILANYYIVRNIVNLYKNNYNNNPSEYKVKTDIYIKSLIINAENALETLKSMENLGSVIPLYFSYVNIINKYINDTDKLRDFLLDKKLLVSEYNPEDLAIYNVVDSNVMLYIYGLVEKYNENNKENPMPKNVLANILFTNLYDKIMDVIYIGNKSAVMSYKSRPDIINKDLLSLNIALAKAV